MRLCDYLESLLAHEHDNEHVLDSPSKLAGIAFKMRAVGLATSVSMREAASAMRTLEKSMYNATHYQSKGK